MTHLSDLVNKKANNRIRMKYIEATPMNIRISSSAYTNSKHKLITVCQTMLNRCSDMADIKHLKKVCSENGLSKSLSSFINRNKLENSLLPSLPALENLDLIGLQPDDRRNLDVIDDIDSVLENEPTIVTSDIVSIVTAFGKTLDTLHDAINVDEQLVKTLTEQLTSIMSDKDSISLGEIDLIAIDSEALKSKIEILLSTVSRAADAPCPASVTSECFDKNRKALSSEINKLRPLLGVVLEADNVGFDAKLISSEYVATLGRSKEKGYTTQELAVILTQLKTLIDAVENLCSDKEIIIKKLLEGLSPTIIAETVQQLEPEEIPEVMEEIVSDIVLETDDDTVDNDVSQEEENVDIPDGGSLDETPDEIDNDILPEVDETSNTDKPDLTYDKAGMVVMNYITLINSVLSATSSTVAEAIQISQKIMHK